MPSSHELCRKNRDKRIRHHTATSESCFETHFKLSSSPEDRHRKPQRRLSEKFHCAPQNFLSLGPHGPLAPPMDRLKGNLEETLIFHRKKWFLVVFPFNQSIQTRAYLENNPIFADHFYLRTLTKSTDGITPKRCRTDIPFTTTLRLDEGGCYKECPGFFPFLSAKTTKNVLVFHTSWLHHVTSHDSFR